jgi:hypothetical protein
MRRLVPALIVLVVEGDGLLTDDLIAEFELGRSFGPAPDGAQRLTLRALHLSWVGTMAALEIEVLSDCVVEKAHR